MQPDMNFPRPMSQWPIGVKLSSTSLKCTCTFNGGPLHLPLDEPVLLVVNDRCPDHGTEACRRREKTMLYAFRYGTPPERIADVLASLPQTRETWRERIVRKIRSLLHLY